MYLGTAPGACKIRRVYGAAVAARFGQIEQSMAMDAYFYLLSFSADSLGAQRTAVLIINLVRKYLCVIQMLAH